MAAMTDFADAQSKLAQSRKDADAARAAAAAARERQKTLADARKALLRAHGPDADAVHKLDAQQQHVAELLSAAQTRAVQAAAASAAALKAFEAFTDPRSNV